MYIYENHLGGLYTSDYMLDYDELYCEQCGDRDWFIGRASIRAKAWKLLKEITDAFDLSMCEECPRSEDEGYCDNKCESNVHSGGYGYDYVQKFIKENWDE